MKRFYKFLTVMAAIVAIAIPRVSLAQDLSEYTFATGTDATKWISMTSATQILTPSGNDGLASTVQSIGFSFPFGEQVYTQYSVNTDGNLRLGSTVTGTTNYGTPFSATAASTNNPKINAFGCDGYGVANSHYVKALTTVDANGNDMLVVEFCTGTYNSNTRNNLYQWQVHLFANGDIEIVFPDSTVVPPAVAHQCGLCVDASDGWTIDAATNTATAFSNGSSSTNAANTWFDSYRYYSFTRPVVTCRKPVGLFVNNITHDEAQLNWNSPDGNANSYRVYVSATPNIDVATANYTTETDTFTVIGNLLPLTTYYYRIVSDCGGGDMSLPTAERSFSTLRNCGDGFANINDAVSYGTSSGYTYFTYNYNSSTYTVGRAATIYTADEMVGLGMDGVGTINAISVRAGATATVVPMKVYIGKTALSSFSGASDTIGLFDNLTLVYDDTIRTTAQEWFTIPFSTPFAYNPEDRKSVV